ncbi:MAG: thioredoxin domain-containing protein [Myxococcota bacterium]
MRHIANRKLQRIATWLGCAVLLAAQGCEQMGCQQTAKLDKRIADIDARLKKIEDLLPKPPKPQEKPYDIPLSIKLESGNSYTSPVLGKQNAPVSVVVYHDIQCPFCKRGYPLLDQIVTDPQLKEKVNVVFKHFPLSFHKEAKPAAKAAMAAQKQGKFWPFLGQLYENQRNLKKETFEKLIASKKVGGNLATFKKDFSDSKENKDYDEIIKKDMEVGIKTAKVDGTPYMLIGKREGDVIKAWKLSHAQKSVAGIKQMINSKNLVKLDKAAAADQKSNS